jgi:hypothetical protein
MNNIISIERYPESFVLPGSKGYEVRLCMSMAYVVKLFAELIPGFTPLWYGVTRDRIGRGRGSASSPCHWSAGES